MKGIKEFYIIIAAFVIGIVAKIVFLNKGNRKEVKKTIKNMEDLIDTDKEEMYKFDKKIQKKLKEIKQEENEEKRLNKIKNLFKE